ncbi:MAG TPA: SpoIIE family protein phosphatase [Vicinamibacterales bacterium]|nr:SpoIIE family protein phosphatase [Vicinamibacterales bacterium]
MVDLDRWTTLPDPRVGQAATAADPTPLGEEMIPRVLVVDDDQEIHRLLRARLEARGYHVDSAASGEEGIAMLRTVNPDLVFLDVAMSGMTGIDVLDFIRSQRFDVAVILTTAYSSEQVAIAALRHGADDYLRKPFDRGEFQAALDRTIARLTLSRQIKLLRKELEMKQRQLTDELARAAVVQSELLPMENPPLPGFEIGARCLPARAVGGDFYDWQQLPGGILSLTVGDVMGKGMSAALLMATVRAVIRAMVSQHGPADAVQHTAQSLDGDLSRSGSFVTLFHAQLNTVTSELTYVDAGHGQAMLRRANGVIEPVTPSGLPIGVLSTEHYVEGCLTLQPGDQLVIYSDGLSEARPDLFKDSSTLAAQINPDETAGMTAQRLVDLATSAGGQLPDDLTVVVLRRSPRAAAAAA